MPLLTWLVKQVSRNSKWWLFQNGGDTSIPLKQSYFLIHSFNIYSTYVILLGMPHLQNSFQIVLGSFEMILKYTFSLHVKIEY